MNRILFIAFLLAFAPLLRAGEHEPNAEEFKALSGIAQDMDHTTIGEAYEEDRFSRAIQDKMREAIKACAAHVTPPLEVNLIFVIAADGKVEHIFADPDQPVSVCVAAKLSREKVPPPPRPPAPKPGAPSSDWLQLVNVRITQ